MAVWTLLAGCVIQEMGTFRLFSKMATWSGVYPGALGHSPIMAMPGLYVTDIGTSKSSISRVSMHGGTCYICMNTPNQQKSENALFTMGATAVGLPPNIVAISYIPYSIPV